MIKILLIIERNSLYSCVLTIILHKSCFYEKPYVKKGPIEQRTAVDDDIPVLNNFDNIAVDEISAEEIPEPRSAESLESVPEPGKYPYLQSKC